ncbi:MAG: hypothetical protein C4576_35425 [Desulfobacteraceae bacterium]|nr:MAG: hypothetical protein C4576_35425 [Desulfobacteraceae bacterium]
MNTAALIEKAEKILEEFLPEKLSAETMKLEVVSSDGTLFLFRELKSTPAGPLELLRENGRERQLPLPMHVVLSPESGKPVRRLLIPFGVWSNPARLKAIFREHEEAFRDHASIRMMKSIPDGVNDYVYGRSGRLKLLLRQSSVFLAADVFPGGLIESKYRNSEQGILHAAWVLLARSGMTIRPYPFYVLRSDDFFRVERAISLPPSTTHEELRAAEIEIVRGAEEDRKILESLLRIASRSLLLQKSEDLGGVPSGHLVSGCSQGTCRQ